MGLINMGKFIQILKEISEEQKFTILTILENTKLNNLLKAHFATQSYHKKSNIEMLRKDCNLSQNNKKEVRHFSH